MFCLKNAQFVADFGVSIGWHNIKVVISFLLNRVQCVAKERPLLLNFKKKSRIWGRTKFALIIVRWNFAQNCLFYD